MKKNNPEIQDQITALQKLRNFCSSYTPKECDEMLGRLLGVMIEENYSSLSRFSKERLLNYFESIEEVLPALYSIMDKMNNHGNQKGTEQNEG